MAFVELTPTPEYLIKSISEQGYKLETAIADLIDNSISNGADRIEVLLNTTSRPFMFFISDNGRGMDQETLQASMRYPSASIDTSRKKEDLGRFGLGLKTASFSQSRHFTVMSRTTDKTEFIGLTWDIKHLQKQGWYAKVENSEEIKHLLSEYTKTSESYLGEFDKTFTPKTVVIWRGLYKFEDYISEHDSSEVLKTELTERTRGYLALVFHRFFERTKKPIQIRLNNVRVQPFNPFPTELDGMRSLQQHNRSIGQDEIKVEGFVLPTKCIDEVRQGVNLWVPRDRDLLDLEGIYIYRANRIISFGGWLGLTKRVQKMQLARMRIDIGNKADDLLHLNVAKSQVEIPYDIRDGIKAYIERLQIEAVREYHNKTIRKFNFKDKSNAPRFIVSQASSRGALMGVNPDFPVLKDLQETLDSQQKVKLKVLLRLANTELNSIRRVHKDTVYTGADEGLTETELLDTVNMLLANKFTSEYIKSHVISKLGYKASTLPSQVVKLLEK